MGGCSSRRVPVGSEGGEGEPARDCTGSPVQAFADNLQRTDPCRDRSSMLQSFGGCGGYEFMLGHILRALHAGQPACSVRAVPFGRLRRRFVSKAFAWRRIQPIATVHKIA